jgi:hypothetical protein
MGRGLPWNLQVADRSRVACDLAGTMIKAFASPGQPKTLRDAPSPVGAALAATEPRSLRWRF